MTAQLACCGTLKGGRLDFSGLFADGAGSIFDDPAHCTEPGRQSMAEALAGEIVETLVANSRTAARL